jgi:hypothetical protein
MLTVKIYVGAILSVTQFPQWRIDRYSIVKLNVSINFSRLGFLFIR